nr:hypothetical protein [Rhizobium lentis]
MLKRWDGFTVIPGRRQDLPDEQCRRASAQRLRTWQEIMAIRRIGSWG